MNKCRHEKETDSCPIFCERFAPKYKPTKKSRVQIQEPNLAIVREVERADQNYLKQGTENWRESLGEWERMTVGYLGEDRITLAGTRGRRNPPVDKDCQTK